MVGVLAFDSPNGQCYPCLYGYEVFILYGLCRVLFSFGQRRGEYQGVDHSKLANASGQGFGRYLPFQVERFTIAEPGNFDTDYVEMGPN